MKLENIQYQNLLFFFFKVKKLNKKKELIFFLLTLIYQFDGYITSII